MSRSCRPFGRWPVLVAAGLIALFSVVIPSTGAAAAPVADSVRMTVDSIDPFTPTRSSTKQPLVITLTLTNLTDKPLTGVQILAERGEPITTQKELGAPRLNPVTSDEAGLSIPATRPRKVSIPAGQPVNVTFSTTTDIPQDAGICLCANAVYPIYLSAHLSPKGGTDQVLGEVGTYLPVSSSPVPKLKVSWVWPLIDRPHRLTDDTVFEDDELAQSVAPGGRLDRALSVVEDVGPDIPMTLVVDPETIDEIAVMAAGTYQVKTKTSTKPGTGSAAAAAWLDRLHAALTSDNLIDVDETPYADPDVQSLAENGLHWQATMPTAMQDRVRRALDGKVAATDLSWPAGGRITAGTLTQLVKKGTSRLILDSAGVSTGTDASLAPPGIVSLRSGSKRVPTLLTTSRLDSLVADGVTTDGAGPAVIPRLLSELAVHVTEDPSTQQVELLAPPRYVDPDITAAEQTIRATTSSVYTTPASLADLTTDTSIPSKTVNLSSQKPGGSGLPAATFSAVNTLRSSGALLRSMLTADASTPEDATSTPTPAQTLVNSLPTARQRAESSAFRTSDGQSVATGNAYATQLTQLVTGLVAGVHIVAPSTGNSVGSYTLASGSSKLPITVFNELDYPVTVEVRLAAVGDLPGFSARQIGPQRIAAHTKVILHVPASVQRSGRIQVQALLTAPNGDSLGSPIVLSVHSTALGRIGVIIMVVAGALLVLALARRWYVSVSGRRKPVVRPAAEGDPE